MSLQPRALRGSPCFRLCLGFAFALISIPPGPDPGRGLFPSLSPTPGGITRGVCKRPGPQAAPPAPSYKHCFCFPELNQAPSAAQLLAAHSGPLHVPLLARRPRSAVPRAQSPAAPRSPKPLLNAQMCSSFAISPIADTPRELLLSPGCYVHTTKAAQPGGAWKGLRWVGCE